MKNIITAAVAVATIGSVSATNTMMNNAMYGGVSAGYAMGHVKESGSSLADRSVKGFNGGVHVGYMQDMGMMVCGLEANGDLSNVGYTNETTKMNLKNGFGLSARLGKMCGSWMTCLRLGWMNSKVERRVTTGTPAETTEKNNRFNGFVAGVSFETPVMGNMMVGGEYTYTAFSSKKVDKADTVKIAPRMSDFRVRLSYKF